MACEAPCAWYVTWERRRVWRCVSKTTDAETDRPRRPSRRASHDNSSDSDRDRRGLAGNCDEARATGDGLGPAR